MTLLHFNYLKRSLFEKLTPAHAALAETHIDYTLNILQQETMSAEALATIISFTKPTSE